MPTHKDDDKYNMNHKRRGKAIIFNHLNFHPSLGLNTRNGTNCDRDNLRINLRQLDFEVYVYDDLPGKDVERILEQTSLEDHSEADCIFVAVLSHGELGTLYASDQMYKPDRIWSHFTADKCPSLAGKPKLFFIQVLRIGLKIFLTRGAGLPGRPAGPRGQDGGHREGPDGGGRSCHVQDPQPCRLSDRLQHCARLLQLEEHHAGQLVHSGLLSRHSEGGALKGPPVHTDQVLTASANTSLTSSLSSGSPGGSRSTFSPMFPTTTECTRRSRSPASPACSPGTWYSSGRTEQVCYAVFLPDFSFYFNFY